MPQSWDMGQILLLPLRRKACWGFLLPKNPTASAEITVYSCPILMKFEFSRQIFKTKKKNPLSDIKKLHPEGAELFHTDGHTDGRTDMTKLIIAFHNFSNASENGSWRVKAFCLLWALYLPVVLSPGRVSHAPRCPSSSATTVDIQETKKSRVNICTDTCRNMSL